MIKNSLLALTLGLLALTAGPVWPATITYIGTWQGTGSGNFTNNGPELAAGQKFVVRISYDDASVRADGVDVLNSFFLPSGETMTTINLDAGGNSLDVFVPMEGLDTGGTPYIYVQNETNHFPEFVPNPTLNFVDGSDISDTANIVGLEFEGDFAAGAQSNIIELFNTSPGAGAINMVSQVVNLADPGCCAGTASGLAAAVDLVFDAGPDLVFSAGAPDQTTASNVSQSNDLGAARSDGEDFIDVAWSQAGIQVGNDVTVNIAASGLTNTTDTVGWSATATEQMTGKTATDTLAVSYDNDGPVAEAGGAIAFDAATLVAATSGASASDADLAVNAAVAGFETLTVAPSVAGGAAIPGGLITGSSVVNPLGYNIAIEDSGLATTIDIGTFELVVTDFAGATDTDSAVISYLNAAPTASASATATASGYDFALAFDDADLIVNTLIAGFEELTTALLVDGLATSFFDDLIANGLQSATDAALEAAFGIGAHALFFQVVDRAGEAALVNLAFDVTGGQPPEVPEPGSLVLLLAGLAALGLRRRRPAAQTASL